MSESDETRRPLTPGEIAVLTTLVEEGSFTEAAHRLGLTQPAVSRTVRQIEAALGVELFRRGRKGAFPTAALQRVLPRLHQIQREIASVTRDLSGARDLPHGRIRIAGFRSAVSVLLPPAVSKFMAQYKGVELSLSAVREQKAGVQQTLEDGTADLAVTSIKPGARLCSAYLGSDRYVIVRPRSTARRKPEMERLVLWKERCSDAVPEILEAHDWKIGNRMEVDTDTAVLAMVAHGGGFTIMPELAAEPLPTGLEKVALAREFRRGVWLCGLPGVWDSATGRALARYIRNAAKQRLLDAPPTAFAPNT